MQERGLTEEQYIETGNDRSIQLNVCSLFTQSHKYTEGNVEWKATDNDGNALSQPRIGFLHQHFASFLFGLRAVHNTLIYIIKTNWSDHLLSLSIWSGTAV